MKLAITRLPKAALALVVAAIVIPAAQAAGGSSTYPDDRTATRGADTSGLNLELPGGQLDDWFRNTGAVLPYNLPASPGLVDDWFRDSVSTLASAASAGPVVVDDWFRDSVATLALVSAPDWFERAVARHAREQQASQTRML